MAWQRMSQNPDPGTAGGAVTICYDVTEATLPITLRLVGFPCEEAIVHVITSSENACFDVKLPEGCTGGIVEDESYQSYDFSVIIAP